MKKIYHKSILAISVLFLFLVFISISNLKKYLFIFVFTLSLTAVVSKIIHGRICNSQPYKRLNVNITLGVFLCAFLIRLAYFILMKNRIAQISDFKVILTYAESGKYASNMFYYRMFPHKLLYPFFLHSIGLRDQTKILIFQFICVSLIAVIIFYIGNEIKGKKLGLIASLLYAIWPAHVVYSTVITEEHIAAFLTILCAFLIVRLYKYLKGDNHIDRSLIKKIMIISLGIGTASGICVFFKDWCIIVLIATMIIGSFILKEVGWKRGTLILLCFFVIVFSRYASKQTIKMHSEHLLGGTVNTQNIPCYLYVGLNPYSSGAWNRELYNEYFQFVKETEYDYNAANKIALQKLKKQIIEAPRENMLKLLFYKARIGYGDDAAMTFCARIAMDEEDQKETEFLFQIIDKIDYIYYLMIVVFVVISVLFLMRFNNRYIFWLLLIITGGVLLNLLIECQGRYKYSIQTIWCIMAAYGMDQIYNRVCKINEE